MITIPLSSSSRCLFLEQHLMKLRVNALTIINLVHNTQYKERTSGDSVGFIVFISHGRDGLMGQTQALALLSLTHTFSA
jgi:hypothetical protein